MTIEERVKKLEEKVFKNQSDKEYYQREIDWAIRNIGALQLNSFYYEKNGTKVPINHKDAQSYIDMFINNIKSYSKELLLCDIS